MTRPLHGIVLAGGRSTRMGTDKAALVHPDGRPLARRTIDLLSGICSHVVLSLRHDQPLPPGVGENDPLSIARDPEGPGDGPLAGILASVRLHPGADWIVTACDLPRLDEPTLRHLASSRRPGEAFLSFRSEFDGLPEPLCTCYAAEALPLLERARAEGIRCPRKILIRHDCRLLDPPVSGALTNANTPADWDAARSS